VLAGSDTGVFIGIAGHDYADMQNNLRMSQKVRTSIPVALSIAANRISPSSTFMARVLQ
jgi:acyl transferase domain-containing protein